MSSSEEVEMIYACNVEKKDGENNSNMYVRFTMSSKREGMVWSLGDN